MVAGKTCCARNERCPSARLHPLLLPRRPATEDGGQSHPSFAERGVHPAEGRWYLRLVRLFCSVGRVNGQVRADMSHPIIQSVEQKHSCLVTPSPSSSVANRKIVSGLFRSTKHHTATSRRPQERARERPQGTRKKNSADGPRASPSKQKVSICKRLAPKPTEPSTLPNHFFLRG